jgi:hypothetical protein
LKASGLMTESMLMVQCCIKNNMRKKPERAIATFLATEVLSIPDFVAIINM